MLDFVCGMDSGARSQFSFLCEVARQMILFSCLEGNVSRHQWDKYKKNFISNTIKSANFILMLCIC